MDKLKNFFTSKEHVNERIVLFVLFYVVFSIGGAYNLIHLVAFSYILYLLERIVHRE